MASRKDAKTQRWETFSFASLRLCVSFLFLFGVAAEEPRDPAKAYQDGINYLVKSQNKNGSWGSFESARADEVFLGTSASYEAFGDGSSGLCVLALMKPSRERADA